MNNQPPQRAPSERQLWLLAEQSELRVEPVASVALAMRGGGLHDFSIPEPLRDRLRPGHRVRASVPRLREPVVGWCVAIQQSAWLHSRPALLDIDESFPPLSGALVALGLWLAEYYAATPGQMFAAMQPRAGQPRQVLRRWVQRAAEPGPGAIRSTALRRVEAALQEGRMLLPDLCRAAGVTSATVRRLVQKGTLEIVDERVVADQPALLAEPITPPPDPPLTADQQGAASAIESAIGRGGFQPLLLFGVPGSGKTEVYIHAIRHVVACGRQAIVLVPEIALVTQIAQRLAARLPRSVVLHSRIALGARRDTMMQIASGDAAVVVGTRSAVFAPCPNLGLIVIDEEQESSYKALATPLIHARDAAVKRAQLEGIPVLLGSATPSLETWYNATISKSYWLLRLPQRALGARPPALRLAPAGQEDGGGVISASLLEALRETLVAKRQSILLHNRRGYARNLRCERCGVGVSCPACSSPMVYHRTASAVRCHHCGVTEPAPTTCRDDTCRGTLILGGAAIQRLEEQVGRLLPEARILRLDRDTMRRQADYEHALAKFEAGEADILLGTQMVAKGLDFPGVRLVGVIDADAAADLPDFRAAERAFQLLVQVVGRAGRRDEDSLAVIQHVGGESPTLRDAVRMDFESFAARELAVRERFGLPPYGRLTRLVLMDERAAAVREQAAKLAEGLQQLAGRVDARLQVDAPEPCVLSRRRGMLRYQVLVRGPRNDATQRLLAAARGEKLLRPRVARFTVDVDPVDML